MTEKGGTVLRRSKTLLHLRRAKMNIQGPQGEPATQITLWKQPDTTQEPAVGGPNERRGDNVKRNILQVVDNVRKVFRFDKHGKYLI